MLLTILLNAAVAVADSTGPGTNLLSNLESQGPLVTVLIIAVVWFNTKNKNQAKDIAALNDKLENYMSSDRLTMQKTIDNNTAALEEIKEHLTGK